MPEQNNHALWTPDNPQNTQMGLFKTYIEEHFGCPLNDYAALHQWSINHYDLFWQSVWESSDIIFSQAPKNIATQGDLFHQTKWFEGARLNYAENLLRRRDAHIAIVSILENGDRRTFSYHELHEHVSRIAQHFKSLGVGVGDRVAGIVPNTFEALVAMLATSSVGAIWSSCSPDFGVNAALDRFSQIEPTVLIGVDGYLYGGKVIDCRDKLIQLN
ncbi:MAG: acetoacetyl-CoA synthetase, partial [Cellvibrionaceae bacterium]